MTITIIMHYYFMLMEPRQLFGRATDIYMDGWMDVRQVVAGHGVDFLQLVVLAGSSPLPAHRRCGVIKPAVRNVKFGM